jgi:phage shock protein B
MSVSTVSVALLPLFVVCVVFGTILAAIGLVCWTIVRLTGGGAKGQAAEADESRMIQELYHGLSKMEQRVEALETLLLDRDRRTG